MFGLEFVVIGALIWTLLLGWDKVPFAGRAIFVVLGVRIPRPVLGEGVKLVPLKGLVKLEKVDGRKNNFKISPTDIWTKANDEQAGEVQLDVDVNVEYRIVDPYSFSDVGGLGEIQELLTSLSQQVLRRRFRAHSESEALDEGVQNGIVEELKGHIITKAAGWGIEIIAVFLSKVNRNDPDVRKDVQRYRREKAQQRAEIIETKTVILQAQENLAALKILETDPSYSDRLAAEIEKIRQWRIQETSAKEGKAVVVPFPNPFDRGR